MYCSTSNKSAILLVTALFNYKHPFSYANLENISTFAHLKYIAATLKCNEKVNTILAKKGLTILEITTKFNYKRLAATHTNILVKLLETDKFYSLQNNY